MLRADRGGDGMADTCTDGGHGGNGGLSLAGTTANQQTSSHSYIKREARSHGQRRGSSRGGNEPPPRLERCRREEGVRERIDRGIQVSAHTCPADVTGTRVAPPARSPSYPPVFKKYPKSRGYYIFIYHCCCCCLVLVWELAVFGAVSYCDVNSLGFGWHGRVGNPHEDHSISFVRQLQVLTYMSQSSALPLPQEFPRQTTRGQAERGGPSGGGRQPQIRHLWRPRWDPNLLRNRLRSGRRQSVHAGDSGSGVFQHICRRLVHGSGGVSEFQGRE